MSSEDNDLDLEELSPKIKEHIEQLERVRRDFVANVSHELRTPLTVFKGYLETLLLKKNLDTKTLNGIYQQIYQHSLRMEHIINDLLLLSKLESDEMKMLVKKRVNVAKILSELCDDAKKISGDKQHMISLEADTELAMEGSEEELKSLFSNLIINAVKYTPKHGKIIIRCYMEEDCCIFQVKDTGIGIEKKHIPRITERFYRVDKARSRDSGGTGLGLAIVKHVLIRYHGELLIESELDKGSTFTCRFPRTNT